LANSRALNGCAASLTGAAATKAASAPPAMQRLRLEDVTGCAPIEKAGRGFRADAAIAPRMAFLRSARKNVRQRRAEK
jgi:hypothetical protein